MSEARLKEISGHFISGKNGLFVSASSNTTQYIRLSIGVIKFFNKSFSKLRDIDDTQGGIELDSSMKKKIISEKNELKS